MISIFFRYDDYSALSHPGVDDALIDIFRRNAVPCSFAVVPAITSHYPKVEGNEAPEVPLGGEKLRALREASQEGVVDVLLHGWKHLANAHTGHPTPSEFVGLTLDEQQAILQRGSDFLAGITGVRPSALVPPWNSYNDTTESALERVGFIGISGSRYSVRPRASGRLMYAPITTEIPGLIGAISRAASGNVVDPVIGVMMHPYDFHESGDSRSIISLSEFERQLDELNKRADVNILSISALLSTGRMTAARYLANRPSRLEVAYPAFLEKVGSDPVYRNVADARRRRLRRDSAFVALLLGIGWIGAGLGWLGKLATSAFLPGLSGFLAAIPGLAIALLIGRAAFTGKIYFRAAACLTLLCGMLAAFLLL